MNRQVSPPARLAGALLVAGLVAVACGRGSVPLGPHAASLGPTAQVATAPATPASPTTPSSAATPDASPIPTAAWAPAATYAPPVPADDPVTGELQALDQFLRNIDGSLSGSSAGGE